MEPALHRVLDKLREEITNKINELYTSPASNFEDYRSRVAEINQIETTISWIKAEVRKARSAEGFEDDKETEDE